VATDPGPGSSRLRRFLSSVLLLPLCACAAGPMAVPTAAPGDEAAYAALYPYYAEICAVSQLGKKPGFGAEISSGIGGHAVLYLNGVCRKQDIEYPVLALCDELPKPTADGVGLSVNAHYANANWVAIEGRDFFFEGGLAPDRPLTRDAYRRVLAEAEAKGIYKNIAFHDVTYEDVPAGFTRESFKYEISVATDFAIAFGRNRYCGKVPLSRPQMAGIVRYLDALNEPYRTGEAVFDWNLFTHNCAHMNHNALAIAGLWDEWAEDRFILWALFDFPVPKNEFVNLMRRTNDLPIDDPETLYRDTAARRMLLEQGRLPTEPGAIADLGGIIPENEVYDTKSEIIFYDEPITGSYQEWFDRILSEKRYLSLKDNLAYFATLYQRIERQQVPLDRYPPAQRMTAEERHDFAVFYEKYYTYIAQQSAETARNIAWLNSPPPSAHAL